MTAKRRSIFPVIPNPLAIFRRQKTERVIPDSPEPLSVVFPEIEDIEDVCYPLARSKFQDPDYIMPALEYHDKSKLEAALGAVKNSYYETLPEIAAALIYYMIKNHPFKDGNKRMGIIALYAFLASNDYMARKPVSEGTTVKLAEFVAASAANRKEKVIGHVARWVEKHFEYKPLLLDT